MKLVCERCKAIYAIADDKVRGKVVTLKCKTCGHLIQARGPGATGDHIAALGDDTHEEPATSSAARASATRPVVGKGSVLDKPLRADKASLKPTADLTKSASAASPKRLDETVRESGVKRREPLDEPTFKRARGGADPRSSAPPHSTAVGRFAADEAGKLKRAAAPAPSARTAPRPAAAADQREPARAGGAGEFDGENGSAPKTTIASYDSIVAALGAATPPADEWFLSVDGDQHGPFSKEALEAEIPRFDDQELYVWREGFDDWKPPADVPELEPNLRLAPPVPAGVVRGAKLPAAARAESLRQSPWSAAAKGTPAGEPEPPWKGQSHAEPLPPPPGGGDLERTVEAAPRPVARESSGAEVVSIEAARERAASRPHRGGTPLGTGAAKGTGHDAAEPPRLPPGVGGEAKGAARGDAAGHEAGALASAHASPAASPLAAPEPEPFDELVVSEPSQVVHVRTLAKPLGLGDDSRPGLPASARHVTIRSEESGVQGHIDELAVAQGVVVPAPHHKTNRMLLIAAVGGALATLSLAGVVIFLVARGPQVQVREVVRLKSPEELGADTDVAVARLLAEKQFSQANPGSSGSAGSAGGLVGSARDLAAKRVPGRPAAAGPAAAGPAPAKREPKAEGGTGMAGFFKSSSGTGPGASVAAPNLSGQPEVRKPVGRKIGDDEIVKAINRQRGTLNVCYNRALKQDSTLKSVRLDVTIKIGLSGRPTSVSIHQAAHRSSFLGQCLSDTIRRWSFPSGGDDYTTVMPLVLQGE